MTIDANRQFEGHEQEKAKAEGKTTPLWKRWFVRVPATVVGVLLSLAFMASAFFDPSIADGRLHLSPRFSIGAWMADLPHHLLWVIPFAACAAAVLPLRALSWGLALGPRRAPPFRERYHAVAAGAFVHNALPGQLGDLCRAQLAARRHGLPLFEGFGSALVCKLFEFLALIALVGISCLLTTAGAGLHGLDSAVLIAAALFGVLAALSWSLARWTGPLARWLEARGRLPRLRGVLENLGKGLAPIRSLRQSGRLALASLGPVVAPALGYGLALSALGVPNGLLLGPLLLGAITLSQFNVGLPIGVGMYYLSASWAARALGVPDGDAAALALLTHLTTVITHLAVGFVSIVLYRVRLRDFLPSRARRSKAPPDSSTPSTPRELDSMEAEAIP
ncbi:MAG: flippase-like domain-containing protein [Myxococcales bacterium]|jgi:uncharacterized membrane protein YbhN (UPF0104 family)|nr:flippase-like domain-containing protein [Myxococcales bacterium]